MTELEFHIHPTKSAFAIATLRGHITGGLQAVEFASNINRLIASNIKCVVLDLSGVTLMNSSGLGMLVGGMTTMRKAGGAMRFAAIPANVMHLLEITRLNTVFDIYESVDAALQNDPS
ncbi:MAG: STAS domain-containing protein [Bacteroidota bacterium]|nr:STAS domain-containing protein [Candidatus Kapabacteria bacterium]MDW8220088.1 STAS domain-containing protein [Bacteroidota bacterium]